MVAIPEAPKGFEGRHTGSWPMADEMGLALIRLWCEVLEDANPLYHDAEYARKSRHGGITAPPAMIMPLCVRPEWTPEGSAGGTSASLQAKTPDHPHGASLEIIETYHRPLRAGERAMVHGWETEFSPETMTERGPGRVSTRYMSMRDAEGREIASHSLKGLRFKGSAPPKDEITPSKVPPGETLRRRRPEEPPLYWKDVREGEALPPLYMPLSLKRCIKWVAATRDFYEVHHDREYARRVGTPDLFIGVHFFNGLIGRYATDWAGPHGDLCRLVMHPTGRSYPGDVVELRGRVARKFREGGAGRVDLAMTCGNARGVTHTATITVALPDR